MKFKKNGVSGVVSEDLTPLKSLGDPEGIPNTNPVTVANQFTSL